MAQPRTSENLSNPPPLQGQKSCSSKQLMGRVEVNYCTLCTVVASGNCVCNDIDNDDVDIQVNILL